MTPLIVAFALLFAVLLFVACAQPHKRPETMQEFAGRVVSEFDKNTAWTTAGNGGTFVPDHFAQILLRMNADMDAERRQRQLLEDQYR